MVCVNLLPPSLEICPPIWKCASPLCGKSATAPPTGRPLWQNPAWGRGGREGNVLATLGTPSARLARLSARLSARLGARLSARLVHA